jgi:hypothetical protein
LFLAIDRPSFQIQIRDNNLVEIVEQTFMYHVGAVWLSMRTWGATK